MSNESQANELNQNQQQESTKTNSWHWNKSLAILRDILAVIGIFGMVSGVLISWLYLNQLNQPAVFADVLSQPTALMGVLLSFSLIILLSFVYLVTPYSINILRDFEEYFSGLKARKLRLILFKEMKQMFWINLFWMFGALGAIISIENVQFWQLFLCYIPFLLLSFLHMRILRDRKKIKNNKNVNIIYEFSKLSIFIVFHWLIIFSFALFILLTTITISVVDAFYQWVLVILGFIFLIPMNIIAIKDFEDHLFRSTPFNIKYHLTIITIIGFVFIILLAVFGNIKLQSLYLTKFIEKPKDSSWYIIHNGNTTSDKINGFDTKQINIFKKEFSKPYQCTGIEGDILYGYMAWNLGNTKVFCPQSVDFFKTDNQDERNAMSQKCLVIDGKYLQFVSEHYLK